MYGRKSYQLFFTIIGKHQNLTLSLQLSAPIDGAFSSKRWTLPSLFAWAVRCGFHCGVISRRYCKRAPLYEPTNERPWNIRQWGWLKHGPMKSGVKWETAVKGGYKKLITETFFFLMETSVGRYGAHWNVTSWIWCNFHCWRASIKFKRSFAWFRPKEFSS
jgi:hypothetical protein